MWNKSEFKISQESTIYHPKYGQLCYSEIHENTILYHPFKFISKKEANLWIESQCFDDIQKELTLGVGFTTKLLIEKDKL